MSRFSVRKTHFGDPVAEPEAAAEIDEATDGIPSPKTIRLDLRRMAGIKEAADVLKSLPAPGESLHCLCTARMDLTDVIVQLGQSIGACDSITIATLGYNERNLSSMLAWLDGGAVKRLTLLASIFFRSHKGDLWAETLREFRARGQRAACCHSHAKVICLAFTTGERLTIEGSANLCGNGSGREQFALINDGPLHDWHSNWIIEMVARHETTEGDESNRQATS